MLFHAIIAATTMKHPPIIDARMVAKAVVISPEFEPISAAPNPVKRFVDALA
jgi:hypothetical protein